MKVLTIAAAMAIASIAHAGPGADRNHSGADDFRDVVVQCLMATLAAPTLETVDPVYLAGQCIDATQAIWAAAYPSDCGPDFGP